MTKVMPSAIPISESGNFYPSHDDVIIKKWNAPKGAYLIF